MFVGKYSDGSDALSYHGSQLVDILDFSLVIKQTIIIPIFRIEIHLH